MGSPAIFKGANVKLLKDQIEFFNNAKYITNVATDPTSVATEGEPGSVLVNTSGEAYIKLDSGSTTNWLRLSENVNSNVYGSFNNETISQRVTNWSTGNNATFLGGGSLAGTFADNSTSPQNGVFDYSFTQAAGSLNDYIASPLVTIPVRAEDDVSMVKFIYTYDGDDDDITPVVWDVTNSNNLISSADLIKEQTGTKKVYQALFFIPSSATTLRFGFQVAVANNGAILKFDDVEIIDSPLPEVAIQRTESARFDVIGGFGSSNTKCIYFTNERTNTAQEFATITNDSTDGFKLVANKPCNLYIACSGRDNATSNLGITLNPSASDRDTAAGSLAGSSPNVVIALADDANGGQGVPNNVSANIVLDTGDEVYIQSGTTAPTDSVFCTLLLTNSELEAKVSQEDQVQNNFNARIANNGTATITSQVGDWISSVSRTSLGFVQITFKTGLFNVAPAIKVTNEGASTFSESITAISTTSCTIRFFNTAGTSTDIDFSVEASRQGADFRSPLLPKLNVNQVAYVKDVKSNGTNAGTFTSGAWQTRDLNTIEGDDFVTVASNQFTLPAGKYIIEAEAAAYQVDSHRVRINNITDSDTRPGTNAFCNNSGDDSMTTSTAIGTFILDGQKTFELQHRCSTTKATDGFGRALSFSDDEHYAQVKITKVR